MRDFAAAEKDAARFSQAHFVAPPWSPGRGSRGRARVDRLRVIEPRKRDVWRRVVEADLASRQRQARRQRGEGGPASRAAAARSANWRRRSSPVGVFEVVEDPDQGAVQRGDVFFGDAVENLLAQLIEADGDLVEQRRGLVGQANDLAAAVGVAVAARYQAAPLKLVEHPDQAGAFDARLLRQPVLRQAAAPAPQMA